MDVLLIDDGSVLRGYDCRDVLQVEEIPENDDAVIPEKFLVHLGRMGSRKEVRCREVVGFFALTPREVRPVPEILRERLTGEIPWGVGLTDRGLCLLF